MSESGEDPMTSSIYSEESDLDTTLSQAGHSSAASIAAPWYAHLLDFDDLAAVDPERGEFLSALQVQKSTNDSNELRDK